MTKNPSDKIVAKRIKLVREEKQITQAQLAAEASITPAAISQIESGDRVPSTPVLRRIASVLNVSVDYLLGASDEVKIQDLLANENVQKFFRSYQGLSTQDQKLIQQQIEFLKSKNEHRK